MRAASAICVPDRMQRGERGHRLLEDHGDAPAADVSHLVAVARQGSDVDEVLAQRIAEDDLTTRDAGILRQKPHHGLNGDRFSGTGFADDRQGAATVEVEIHVAQRMHDARFAGEIDGEVADTQDAMVAGHPSFLPRSNSLK